MLPDSARDDVLTDSPGLRPSWLPWDFFHSRMLWVDPITSRRELRRDWKVPPPRDSDEITRLLFGPDYFLDELWGPKPIWLDGVPDFSDESIRANLTSGEAWIVDALFSGGNMWPTLPSTMTVACPNNAASYVFSDEDLSVLRAILRIRDSPDRALELVDDLWHVVGNGSQLALSPVARRAVRDWNSLRVALEHGRPSDAVAEDLYGVAVNLSGTDSFWIPGDWGARIARTIKKLVPAPDAL